MSVNIDARSAALLLAEGAIRFDADTWTVTRDGEPAGLPSDARCPVLIYGSETAVRQAVARLENRGLAAWQVIEDPARDTGPAAGRTADPAADAP